MVSRNFILPEPASYVFFFALFNLRNLLYIIGRRAFLCPDAVKWHGQSELHSTPTCSLTEPEGVLFCCPVWAGMEAKAMNGHIEDKPKDCRYCYFWKQTEGCTSRGKTGCYYISAFSAEAVCRRQRVRRLSVWAGVSLHRLVYEGTAALYGHTRKDFWIRPPKRSSPPLP